MFEIAVASREKKPKAEASVAKDGNYKAAAGRQ